MESIFSTLPSDAQTSIQTIHDSYKTKYEALRAEENTQVEAIIAKYPDVKAKYDTAKANRPTQGGRGEREMDDDGQKATVTSTTTATN